MNDMAHIHDRDAERAVLAACLWSPLARETTKRHLIPSDFYEPAHETVWQAMLRLERFGKAVDAVSILAVTNRDRGVAQILPDLVTYPAVAENVGQYAEIVRSWSTKRQINRAAITVQRDALNPNVNAVGYAASVVNQFAAIRDAGVTEDSTSRTLAEILAEPDAEPDWLIPGLLERRDRLMLTGEEGLGKSHLLRQFAICAAAGIDPWGLADPYEPVRAMIIDCENSDSQVRHKVRGIAAFARHYGRSDVAERVFIDCRRRMDITRDKDLASIHRELDLWQPDLLIIGPLYRLVPRAIQTDDEAAPILAALDTIRDRDVALLIEAHAGHAIGKGGSRDLRPRGSSALLGWPEFGYGMRDMGAQGHRYAEFIGWRGDRSQREWPKALRRDNDGVRWIPYDGPREVDAWSA